ncbi:MAG: cobyrinate a,c-diamide synthase [Bacillota bacterium]
MMDRRIVIAGTSSGVGKTTVTIGLMAALQNRGYTVQGFKCGPDYIDTSYHTAVTGRRSRNLDSWMLDEAIVKEIVQKGSEGADISVMEGVMGFYDGKNPKTNEGSTAEISIITASPVLLVVDCSSMARSAAAIVMGFQSLSADVNIVGVVANKVGGKGHFQLIKEAVEQECNIPVIGYLNREMDISMPERHLGLIPTIERGDLDELFERLGELVEETIDIDLLYQLAKTTTLEVENSGIFTQRPPKGVKIAVAFDRAFNFYYQENLELLQAYGAELVYFSPLNGEALPDGVQGLYLGGGFPEEYVDILASQIRVKESIQNAIQEGIPTFAECGGFMYLCDALTTVDGRKQPMVGIIFGEVTMQEKLAAIGYREVCAEHGNCLMTKGEIAKGHEFHYSTFLPGEDHQFAYETKGTRGKQKEGYVRGNLVAGYTHIHFASNPKLVENWINRCLEWKANG